MITFEIIAIEPRPAIVNFTVHTSEKFGVHRVVALEDHCHCDIEDAMKSANIKKKKKLKIKIGKFVEAESGHSTKCNK